MKKMDRQKKEKLVGFLSETINGNRINLVVSFSRLSVPDMQKLRGSVSRFDGNMMVTKKTLLQKTFENLDRKEMSDYLDGPILVVWSRQDDEVALIKSLLSFKSKKGKIFIKCGLIDREVFGEDDIALLGRLPEKKELEAKLVGVLRYPLTRVVNTFKFNISRVIADIKQIKEKKEKEDGKS